MQKSLFFVQNGKFRTIVSDNIRFEKHPMKIPETFPADSGVENIFQYLNKKCPNVELFRCCIFWYIFYLTMIRHIVVYSVRDPEQAFFTFLQNSTKFYPLVSKFYW